MSIAIEAGEPEAACRADAARGIGKTFVALSIAVAVASGGKIFHWEAEKPRRTRYISDWRAHPARDCRGHGARLECPDSEQVHQ